MRISTPITPISSRDRIDIIALTSSLLSCWKTGACFPVLPHCPSVDSASHNLRTPAISCHSCHLLPLLLHQNTPALYRHTPAVIVPDSSRSIRLPSSSVVASHSHGCGRHEPVGLRNAATPAHLWRARPTVLSIAARGYDALAAKVYGCTPQCRASALLFPRARASPEAAWPSNSMKVMQRWSEGATPIAWLPSSRPAP